jgi:hypothetical protein
LETTLARTCEATVHAPGEDIGHGWMINHFPQWDADLTFMNGIVGGYSAYLGFDAGKHLAVVVLSSNLNLRDKVGHNLLLRLAAANPPKLSMNPPAAGASSRE